MAEAAATGSVAARTPSRTQFLLRRLHSLSGIVPVGGYLLFHWFENLKALSGPDAYNALIREIGQLAPAPYFYVIEWSVILLPLLFHALFGFMIWFTGTPNVGRYPYRRNWLYALQRWTGAIAFAFIVFHFLQWRWTSIARGSAITYGEVSHDLGNSAVLAWYVVGNVAAAFHLGNGLYGFAWSWGLAVSQRARNAMEYVGWGAFVAMSILSVNILWSLHRAALAAM